MKNDSSLKKRKKQQQINWKIILTFLEVSVFIKLNSRHWHTVWVGAFIKCLHCLVVGAASLVELCLGGPSQAFANPPWGFSKHSPVNIVPVKSPPKIFDLSSATEEVARPHLDRKNFTSSPRVEVEPPTAHRQSHLCCLCRRWCGCARTPRWR